MAKSEQYSRSVLGSADEVKDIYREPSHQDGQVAIAEGYCVDCPEYLCGPCYKIHQQRKALENHVLVGKDSMPLSAFSRRAVNVCEEKCPIHPNKVIKLFCETCDKLVCHICVETDHCRCEKVKYIPDIVTDLEHVELHTFIEDIKSTANELSKREEELQAKVTSDEEMRTLAKQELKRQRGEVGKLEKKMDDQITAIEKRNRDTLKAASDRLNRMKTDLDQIKNDMKAKNTGQRCELFIAMKRSQKKLMTFCDQLEKMQEELRIQHYAVLPSEQIQAMMETTTEIFGIATARFDSEIDIKTSTDKKDPLLYDLTIMHGHYCVALDNDGNNNITVIDTKSKCVTSKITIKANEFVAVTPVSDDQIALSVLLSGGKQIQFFTVSTSGVIQRTNQLYDVDVYYIDMVHCTGNIYGVLPGRVDKLNMTGKIIKTIYTDDKGYMMGIARSPDGQTLYVTDNEKHSVTSMTLDGQVKVIYKDKGLKRPVGITVDKHGYVYVCSYGTGNIQQFTADLNKVQVLIDVWSNTITYSSTENKLYVRESNQIHMYSLDF
jgi:DNA-binding beta-propeller fold protein YncE